MMSPMTNKVRLISALGALNGLFSAPRVWAASSAPELNLATTFGSLLLVIAFILLLAWLMKRLQAPAFGQQHGLKIVSQIAVGTKERIAVVQAGEEQFLVGITAQSIQLIARLEQPLKQEELVKSAFASQFSQLLKKHEQ
ncbi:flagellar biosynthetic protein FliO [Vibrio navarrensis]|uniref:flagellar biosynthetic protein FliO n=1 Tax=Vibrio navarrensis TaxID=29495 RepID=UPI00192F5EC8|nr:flagellar biosynthetic protein FliO [Vibrio navarrensis]MBE3668217.1 flagellar biosynthetic protein FliO [Vibrio navarrensis]